MQVSERPERREAVSSVQAVVKKLRDFVIRISIQNQRVLFGGLVGAAFLAGILVSECAESEVGDSVTVEARYDPDNYGDPDKVDDRLMPVDSEGFLKMRDRMNRKVEAYLAAHPDRRDFGEEDFSVFMHEEVNTGNFLEDYERSYMMMVFTALSGILEKNANEFRGMDNVSEGLEEINSRLTDEFKRKIAFFRGNAIIPFMNEETNAALMDGGQFRYLKNTRDAFLMIPVEEDVDSEEFPLESQEVMGGVPTIVLRVDFKSAEVMFIALMGEIEKAEVMVSDLYVEEKVYPEKEEQARLRFRGLVMSAVAMYHCDPGLGAVFMNEEWQEALENREYPLLIRTLERFLPYNSENTSLQERRLAYYYAIASMIEYRFQITGLLQELEESDLSEQRRGEIFETLFVIGEELDDVWDCVVEIVED